MFRAFLVAQVLMFSTIASPATGQNVPLPALNNWMWYNENGWDDLDKGKY